MSKTTRLTLIILGLIVAVLGAVVYWEYRPVPGVEVKGDDDVTAWIGLATSIVGLLTALVTLANTYLQSRRGQP